MVAFSAYVLTQYGWETCGHTVCTGLQDQCNATEVTHVSGTGTHDLFKQSIISIFNSIITGILMLYIIVMPERGNPNYDSGVIKFGIGYVLQTVIVFVNTYLFFESGIYCLMNAKYSDCNKLYYYTIYTNVILGCIPQYMLTIYFVMVSLIKCTVICMNSRISHTTRQVMTQQTQTQQITNTPVFINPEDEMLYDDSELEYLIDAQER